MNVTPRGANGSYSKKNINAQIKESNPFRKSYQKDSTNNNRSVTPDRGKPMIDSKTIKKSNPEEKENPTS